MLTASNTSKTAKIIKGDTIPTSALPNVNVLLSSNVVSPFMIFAVFDVLLAVNMCINYSFLHLYLQFYYSRKF